MFQIAIWRFEELRAWTVENVEQVLRELGDQLDLKLRVMTRPFYVALSGRKASTPLFDSMVILGSDMTRVRLRRAIDALGGLGGKKTKALEKRYAEMYGR
jgi:glutamyl-tRNA synthetase